MNKKYLSAILFERYWRLQRVHFSFVKTMMTTSRGLQEQIDGNQSSVTALENSWLR